MDWRKTHAREFPQGMIRTPRALARSRKRYAPGSAGHSLIEVMVSTLIAAGTVLGFSAGILSTNHMSRQSERYAQVSAVAQGRLALLAADLKAGRPFTAGTASEGELTVSWEPLVIAGLPAGVTPFRVTVSWAGPQPGSLAFDSAVYE